MQVHTISVKQRKEIKYCWHLRVAVVYYYGYEGCMSSMKYSSTGRAATGRSLFSRNVGWKHAEISPAMPVEKPIKERSRLMSHSQELGTSGGHKTESKHVPCLQGLECIFGTHPGQGEGKTKRAVLLDQFGVLHDGKDAYPGAIEAVDWLSQVHGLRLLIVSNSSRRSEGALENLKKKGFHIDSIEGVITSGEVTFQKLHEREDSFWRDRKDCVHLTWGERGAISLEGTDMNVVGKEVDTADCILAHGTEALGMRADGTGAELCSIDEMEQILTECSEREGVPMIVANPDLVTVHGDELRVMPGTLAAHYESRGGEVYRMGKPAKVIYEEALRMLQLTPDEVIAIGDSLEHDINGAQSMGIDTIFIGGGIHKNEVMEGSSIDPTGLEMLCNKYESSPTYVIPYFVP